jgi:hypothetical protein
MKLLFLAIACLCSLVPCQSLHATLFHVSLIDDDGPQILGEVDSGTDTFTVTSWLENAGGTAFWSPSQASLPVLYTALDPTGAVFDVPEDWNGTIDLTWGFVADLRNADITWNEGVYTDIIRHHGWGGGVSRSLGLKVDFFDYTRWQWTPTGPSAVDTPTFDSIAVTVIPEPASMVLFCLGALGLVACNCRRLKLYHALPISGQLNGREKGT